MKQPSGRPRSVSPRRYIYIRASNGVSQATTMRAGESSEEAPVSVRSAPNTPTRLLDGREYPRSPQDANSTSCVLIPLTFADAADLSLVAHPSSALLPKFRNSVDSLKPQPEDSRLPASQLPPVCLRLLASRPRINGICLVAHAGRGYCI